jgi:hypothetical protein
MPQWWMQTEWASLLKQSPPVVLHNPFMDHVITTRRAMPW